MTPWSIDRLARSIAQEFGTCRRVLGIPEALFAPAEADPRLRCAHMGHALENPLGVAAGPHTQLAQNIVAAYLAGARFIELKTVQILDHLDVAKPCIDMRDLGYNCEWSQELTLEQSFSGYADAFVLARAVARWRGADPGGYGFNMSVGYDLAGVTSAAVRRFIDRMRDPGDAIAIRAEAVRRAFAGTPLAAADPDVPAAISNDVTLSTMHGCPPGEIERIGLHLIEELGVHTTVKLNPTLLGRERLRHLLHDRLGYTDVEVPDEAFAHDPTFEEACDIVRALDGAARRAGVRFAVKLTNTLETRNVRGKLPAKEALHYMSGRALHPLAAALAAKFAERFGGAVPISLSGGVDAFNSAELLACGVRPLTVSSDLLRPGGYGRLSQYLDEIGKRLDASGVEALGDCPLDAAKLAAYAERAAGDPRYARRAARPVFSSTRPLDVADCMAAPCRDRCPAHQDVPGYLREAAEGRAAEALAVILRDNPLPATTGRVCHHPCTAECTRNLLDDPVAIREVKRWAEENGSSIAPRETPRFEGGRNGSVGVVGAGPAGLAAAAFCRRAGLEVTVYESRDRAGGVPGSAIPGFRLDDAALARDIARVEALGACFAFGRRLGDDLEAGALCASHDAVLVATGAGPGGRLGVPGEEAEGVHDAIGLLGRVRAGGAPGLGRDVLVIGGGNSAVDAARAAKRIAGDAGRVTIVYRRSRAEMPAAPEEIGDALSEGIAIEELLAPGRVLADASGRVCGLECVVMRLGDRDAGGRRRPVPAGAENRRLAADSIVVAVGQGRGAFDGSSFHGVPGIFVGGDAARGAASIIEAVADARAFADAVAGSLPGRPEEAGGRLEGRRSGSSGRIDVNALLAARSRRRFREEDPRAEAARCLGCDELCALCVTVCPNRANVLYEVEPAPGGPAQRFQIANLADLCNACGNCEAFCPTGGAPHRDKPRICFTEADAQQIRDGTIVVISREDWRITVRRDGADVAPEPRLAAIGRALHAAFRHLA